MKVKTMKEVLVKNGSKGRNEFVQNNELIFN